MPNNESGLNTAQQLDAADPLRAFRNEFLIPESGGSPDIYFVGNSLGLQPRRTRDAIQSELDQWQMLGVRGHFDGELPWMDYQEAVVPTMADIAGAKPDEVVIMNTLTVNLHLMMATFYQPTNARHKILIEDHAFPSDHQAVESHIRMRGHAPEDSLLLVRSDDGEWLISTARICETIREHQNSLALILLPGLQYYTGQVFDMEAITRVAREYDIPVGFDLAHAAGNIPLQLHDWDVDFACWCTYKYLNSGPGALGGCFIHQRHASNTELPRLAGWWGHDRATLFEMRPEFQAMPTAQGWQLSNPPILSLAAIRASLEVFREAGGMTPLREKSLRLSRFFRDSLTSVLGDRVRILTPDDPDRAGCQLSLEIHFDGACGKDVYNRLEDSGIRTDWREPNVIRAAPTPLYNTFEEVWRFVEALNACLP